MKPKIEDTDIIIRRAANGWIVFSGSEYEEGHFITTVYEETVSEWEEPEVCEDWGERKGLILSNKSKLFRDDDKARKKAASIDTE
jgi:hypothetical protein